MSIKCKTLATVFALLLIVNLKTGAVEKLPEPFIVIPQPKNVLLGKGHGPMYTGLTSMMLSGLKERPVTGELLAQLPQKSKVSTGTVLLVLDKALPDMPSEEGYILKVTSDRVEIRSKSEAGIFYGCQTLGQLMEDSRDHNAPMPACEITDYPALSYRAVHFDVKHHLDHIQYYYESIDRLARYKINAVVFEFEDKLRYRRQPLVGAPQSISIDEMAALTLYARKRNIEITPLVQGLGHATFILKHEEYAGLRELSWNPWAFCPLNEGTYQVLFDLYRDAIDATPGSKYLHIGGDEIGNIGLCPRCKPMADSKGMLSLSLYWLKRVCEFAEQNGRIPVFWDDMPLKEGGVYESTWSDEVTEQEAVKAWKEGTPKLDQLQTDFPKNCVYMRWNYSMARQPGNILALDWYHSRGLKTMIATATNTEGGMLFQPEIRDKGNASEGLPTIRSFIQLAAERKLEGMLCTAWDDKSPHMENYWRGFIAAAEYSWSPEGRNLEEYDKAWLQREFGLEMPDYLTFFEQLRKGSLLWYSAYLKNGGRLDEDNTLQSLQRLEHWLPALAGQEKVCFDYTSKLIELPDPNNPGGWSTKYREKLDRAATEKMQHDKTVDKLKKTEECSLRNRYYWELSRSMYDLQYSAPEILLALKDCDSSDPSARKAGVTRLKQAISDFNSSWENLQKTYSTTRFISFPPGYVPDRYFHLASQAEDLTWMIQPEKLFFGMMDTWIKTLK
jgi:hexosaminidase